MHVRGRLAIGRSSSIALALAAGLLVAFASGPALAGQSTADPSPEPPKPTPREQQPGAPSGFRLPFKPGPEITIHQGWNTSFSHNGLAAYGYDFGLPEGTPVLAAASGVVRAAHGGARDCGGEELLKKTNYVTIDHPDGSATHYGHLLSVEVEVGDLVESGQEIGLSGKTGYSSCLPHLHFARQEQGGVVTQSVPVYFVGFEDRAFVTGDAIAAPRVACSQAEKKLPTDAFCATYSALGPDGPGYFSRLEPSIDRVGVEAAPGGYWLDDASAGYAAHWSGRFGFVLSGRYTVNIVLDGTVRLTIDDQVLLETSTTQTTRLTMTTGRLMLGDHRVSVEHEDVDGLGTLVLDWTFAPDGAAGRWTRAGVLQG